MRMKLPNESQKICWMEKCNPNVCICYYHHNSGHQNQWLLKYGNKTAIASLGQTPSRFTILRPRTGKLFVDVNARQVFLISYAWALELSTAMCQIKQSDRLCQVLLWGHPSHVLRNDAPKGLLHHAVPCPHLGHLPKSLGPPSSNPPDFAPSQLAWKCRAWNIPCFISLGSSQWSGSA